MTYLDYLMLIVYAAGMLLVGSILSRKNRSTADMFAVSKQSPWWLSGISAFMSAFSAGTFVVWGGIAYKEGAVAITILMTLGISSFIVGKFIAGKWAVLGITTVGEYINLRFGKAAVLFYTWVGALFKFVAMSVALYSFSTLLCSLIDLPEGNFLGDPITGKLAVTYACILSGCLMLIYAVSGGLWAVLIIDSIQFVVLMTTILFVVPLSFNEAGGMSHFFMSAPEGFLNLTNNKFTFLFFAGWIVIHVFKFGGEWVFIQRFLSVGSPKAAKKSSYLFGILYLISPVFWMLPPMIYRTVNANVNAEQAYFVACASVLPHGMMGLLLAAMFSSAASYIDGEVNVYAGAITDDIYKLHINPRANEKQLLLVGRISSFLIGCAIIGGAISIPYIGGAEEVILTITSLLVVPMALPVIWGLFFGKITQEAVWYSTALSFLAAISIKFFLPQQSSSALISLVIAHRQSFEVGIGVFVPFLVLLLFESTRKEIAAGFLKLQHLSKKTINSSSAVQFIFPARLMAISIGVLSALMFILALSARTKVLLLASFGLALGAISMIIFYVIRTDKRKV